MELISKEISNQQWRNFLIAVVTFFSILIWFSPYYVKPVVTICALLVFSITLFKSPHMVLLVAILLPPILGRPDEILYYPFQSMDWVTIWLILFGSFYSLVFLGSVIKEKLILIYFSILILEILTFPLSNHFGRSISEIARYLSVLIVLPLILQLSKDKEARSHYYSAILISMAIPLIVGYYQVVSGDISLDSVERTATARELEEDRISVYSTFWYNHPFAKYLRIVIPLILASLFFSKDKITKWLFAVASVGSLIMLAFTNARSQFIGTLIAIVLIIYALDYLKAKYVIKFGPLLIPLLILIIFGTGLDERFSDLMQPIDLSSNVRENSLKMRFLIWAMGFPGILNSPLFGHGPDTFGGDIGIVSHNDYLGMWYNLGIFGLIMYAMIFIFTFRYLMKHRNLIYYQSWKDKAIYYATIGVTVALAIESLVENIFDTAIMWRIYLVMVGCSISIINEHRTSINQSLQTS